MSLQTQVAAVREQSPDSDCEMTAEDLERTTVELVDEYTWRTLLVEGPESYICPVYRTVFPERPIFDEACVTTPLETAPSLGEVFSSDTPPTIDFFRSLPLAPKKKVWAIYAHVYTKADHKPRLYIGSGTSALGVHVRLGEYYRGHCLPINVGRAVKDGFTRAHTGLLYWSAIPAVEQIPLARVRFFAMEAMFCQVFFAAHQTKLDHLWDWVPWKRTDVNWVPMCSHSPLMERPAGELDMTPEQLIAYNQAMQVQAKKRVSEAGRRYEARQQATNRADYLARKLRNKHASMKSNPERQRKMQAGVRARAIASGKHRCDLCDLSCPTASALKIHETRKGHLENVRVANGGEPTPVSATALRARVDQAKMRASGDFRCLVCGTNYAGKHALARHNLSNKHINNVYSAQKEAEAAA
ncbi:hypothetical protein NQ176_g4090 [Zarea fungicola]|uniref:Uncharacterized protein n=1 Tax=Zarea fungicola TaxID=93591 RepID=A0ACC1NFX5_9HYPO|nr:hypothetical protein NQ176_g4090 [Lecanicillium fungicola]